MKFQLLISALLFGSSLSQSGYPNTFGSNLPNLSTTKSASFPTADLQRLNVGSTDPKVTESNIKKVIGNASTQLSTSLNSFQSLFTRHPSKTQLIKFADDGDVAAISRTLQNLASDDSIPCQAKVSYLLELLGTIRSAVSRKSLAADQLQTIISGAKSQISRLQGEISRVQKNRDALNLNGLNSSVNSIVARLRPIYDQINALKIQLPPEQARVSGYQKEIETFNNINDGQRNRQSNDKLRLVQTDNLIQDLQQKLLDARAQKAALQSSIAASDIVIKDNSNRISIIRNTIAQIQNKIRKIQDNIDKTTRQSNVLQVDQQRFRTDLSVAKSKDKIMLDQIRQYQNRINIQEPKLVDDQLRKIRILIDNLNRSRPQVQKQIDRQYYYCYGAGKIQTIKTDNVIVYLVRGDGFDQYVKKAYGQGFNSPNVRSGLDYRLQVVDPFSRAWTNKFGPAYRQLDFSCFSNSNTSSGTGPITSIRNNVITITDSNGKPVNLQIGSCSRIESTQDLPRVGQTIAWRGMPSSIGYNIYSGTCYS